MVSVLLSVALAQDSGGDPKLRFGGGFDSLEPQQKELVRKWHGEYAEITGRRIDPKLGYDNLPLATRTTFDAVTHALLRTRLTDKETGKPLGTALDVVKLVESVHGQIGKARGDQQYRIYVLLADNALDLLYRSEQFKRVGDNTIYHIGYPINFRQQGGAPSIQVSVTRTGYRADIDVDYRPSSGPRALINGHLTSANSDVRAGGNYARHVHRWEGLGDWWRSLFGVTTSVPQREMAALSSGNNPPRLQGSIPVEDAVQDFFKAWLLEDKPEQALPYISIKALPCIAEFPGGNPKDSMVRLRIYQRMKEVSQRFGAVDQLDQVMQGVVISAPDGQPVMQQYGRLFSLQRIPDDVAREMDCRIRQKMELAAPIPPAPHRIGDFYNAITILGAKDKGLSGQILSQVWAREEGAWKLVSWQMENPFQREKPATEIAVTKQPETPETPADPILLKRVQGFLDDWLLQKKYDAAQNYFAAESLPCAELETGESRDINEGQQRAELRKWLSEVGSVTGESRSLAQTIKTVPFGHAHMQKVFHPDQDAYLMARISDDLAAMDGCTTREKGVRVSPNAGTGNPTFDLKTHQIAFQLQKGDVEAGSIEFDWALRDGNWKIVSFDLLTD